MEISILLLKQIMGMVLMAGAGFVLGRKKLITGVESRVLSCLSIYLITPCSMISAFMSSRDMEKLVGLGIILLCSTAIQLIYLAANSLLHRGPHGLTREEQASVMYNNAGNLTIPIVQNVLGNEYVIFTSPYLLVQSLLMWTHGQKLMGGDSRLTVKKIVTNPVIAGIEIGMVLFLTGLQLPSFAVTAINGLANCIGPLSMVILGIMMSEIDLKSVFTQRRIYMVALVRLVLLPLVVVALLASISHLWGSPSGTKILLVSLLSAVGPSAATIVQQAVLYRNPHAGYVSSINVLTTFFCVVTIPVMAYLLLSLM